MLTKEENERFTQVGRGTPGGEMLRRYWWPVAFGTEVKGKRPKKIRLLGEDFIMFRDGAGRCGLVDLKCPHRRVSLEHGRVEQNGIRCCFHGWLFDTEGRCLEQPCEEPGSTFKDKVRLGAYPAQEAGGLVFVYIGPSPAPLLPRHDVTFYEHGIRFNWGFTDYCNWLQDAEQGVDPYHLSWLHAGPYPVYATRRGNIEFHRRDYGLDYSIEMPGIDDVNLQSVIFPCHSRFASGRIEQVLGPRQNLLYRTPADDHTTLNFFISLHPSAEGGIDQRTEAPAEISHRGPWIPTERGVYPPGDEEWWGVESIMQDRMALESQGFVADRDQEHLGTSDRGVIMWRQFLRESIAAVEAGRDPIGVVRDPARNGIIEFGTKMHRFAPALKILTNA